MNSRLKGGLVAAAAVAVLAGGGAAIAGATGGGDNATVPATGSVNDKAESTGADDGPGQPITGSALDKAKAVALKQTGGGQVTATEIRDEEGYYEVEVTQSDGSQTDVHLDRNYNVLDSSADGSGADEGSG